MGNTISGIYMNKNKKKLIDLYFNQMLHECGYFYKTK